MGRLGLAFLTLVSVVAGNHPDAGSPATYNHEISYSLPGGSHVYISRTFPITHGNGGHRSGRVLQHSHNHNHVVHPKPPTSPSEGLNYSGHNPPKEEKFSPFNPRYKISRLEVTDDEWKEELGDIFRSSGILKNNGGLLKRVPKGLVNINFGTHSCVHMGTDLRTTTCAEKPTAISYPVDLERDNQKFSLVMVDMDHEKGPWLHWMVVDIPGSKVDLGTTVVEYQTPIPAVGSGTHRFVILVMEQEDERLTFSGEQPYAFTSSCDDRGRSHFDVNSFRTTFNLKDPIAANYFQAAHDDFVKDIEQVCHAK